MTIRPGADDYITTDTRSTDEYDNSTAATSTSTTSTSTDVNWGVILPQLYEDAFRSFPSRLVLRQMYDWVQLTSLDVLRYALEEAACAPAPSWRYALAILRDCRGLHVQAKPGQSLRIAVEDARGYKTYLDRRRDRQRYRTLFPVDDETRMPWEE